jgi:hypothetical protein
MEHAPKCTAVLRPLIPAGETNGIPPAEKAIDEMLQARPADQHRNSLDSFRSVVDAHKTAASGSQLGFAHTVNDYIERPMRALE